ncbi:right-handed parallel beta-helix repeat-containing protein [Methylocapsa acidiphila]|uniref:right-handed parallel beta-helix repeat-containing protein n=1 Tax=Methylocapsa acidiphila TaxID=133552 RepID=UPI00040D3902|nr:right-handed parallel beta-helix repeat-containing protein [Methylocapsa acidiphila]
MRLFVTGDNIKKLIKAFFCVALLFTSSGCYAASTSGTTIPSATQIVDANGGVWTVSSGICYLNGKQAQTCNSVQTLLFYQNKIYAGTTDGSWWLWNGSAWDQASSDPRSTTSTGTPLSSSTAGANLPAAAQATPYYSCSTNWYVDASSGSDSNAGTSSGAPFRTIARATTKNASLAAGGCVNVAPGTYNEFVTVTNSAGKAGNLNSKTGFVVLRSTTALAAKIVGPSSNGYSAVTLPASYAVIDGFDVSGGANAGHCIDGGYNVPSNHAHHLTIINNHAHNCGGSGISVNSGDYYIIAGNTSNNNAGTSGYQTSGISLASAVNATGFTATSTDSSYYHNIVANNISYNNVETFACSTYGMSAGCHTDGEGIIVDCFDCSGVGVYTGRTLVVGNLVYGNGGNGIQVGRSSNVVVANNTSYGNFTDVNNYGTARGELGNMAGTNTTWVNNIAWATPGAGVLAKNVPLLDEGKMSISGVTYPGTGVTWNNNIYWGAGVAVWNGASISSSMNFSKNPGLVAPTGGNFTLTSSSPAQGSGLPEGFLTDTTPNIGAY